MKCLCCGKDIDKNGENGWHKSCIKRFFGASKLPEIEIDDETLKKAQQKPEDYRGLMVRVAGYMAYFTELDKAAQDSIIYRTAHLKA